MNHSEYIIDLAKRYKNGKLSKQMFSKYSECAFNCLEYEIKPPKDFAEFITLSIEMKSLMTNLYLIMSQPKPPKHFKEGAFIVVGTKGNEEVMLPDGGVLTPKNNELINLPKIIKQ